MKHLFFTCLFIFSCTLLLAQERIIKGRVSSVLNTEGLPGVNIQLKGSGTGVVTNTNGYYEIAVPGPQAVLVFSFVGFVTEEVPVGNRQTIDIRLAEDLEQLGEVVISGTRRAEKITETPATIEVIGKKDLENIPTFNPGELLARVKGVEFVRAGVVGTGINVRGFNSNFNSKNLQVTDGRFSTLVATGLPMGPLNTVIKEDIERIEVVLGPNAALFGPNAHNGLVNTITKDPRSSAGTTFALGAGNQSMFTARARHAQVLGNKFAFKVTGEYTRAEEFAYTDSVYLPAPAAGAPKIAVEEFSLDNDIEFLRGETALYFSPVSGTDIIVQAGASNSTYLSPTNVGRNQIKDWRIFYTQAKLVHDNWFAQIYHTWSKTDDTYSLDDYTKAYYRLSAANQALPEDQRLSEAQIRENAFKGGALFQDASRRWNAELQYNNHINKKFYYTLGAQLQRDMANSLGTYLLDKTEDDYITIDQLGVYGQFDYNFGRGFKATAAFRGDQHEIYDFNFLPKLGLVKSGDWGGVRLTYGQGIAAPTILNMYGNLFGGLILGNAEGFTLADGTTIAKQEVEKMQTFELGYKGQPIGNKFFVDANVYYNISENFLSPLTVIGVATKRGDENVADIQDAYPIYRGLVATYRNFGKFNTYGFDIGLNYNLTQALSLGATYSYFGYSIDEDNLENDFDKVDGKVTKVDLMVNAPNHKGSVSLNYLGDKFFGSVFSRWVQAYDYFSGFQVAARTQPELKWRGVPIVEDARGADAWNYGPLGGFVTFDVSAGYKFNQMFRLSAQVTNLFNTEQREFTAAPPTGRLFSMELRVDLPAISRK